MKDDVVRNLRLACAATLLSIWGMAHLAAVPVLGETLAPLLLALVVAPGSPFAHWRANRAGAAALGIALLALLAITTLLARVGSAEELLAFAHSPWFVLPVWGLGLFGLASFMAEQRTKEIGIRKVLGASAFTLWRMLSKDFALLVLLACCIATPLAWYFLQQWLEKYEYHTTITWWIFGGVGAGAMLIALLTVSYQSTKAALSNPVKSLRSE